MAKAKESKATYSPEPITIVTARGQTEIPRPLRERYGVKAKSRLRWVDTGEGLLVVPLGQPHEPTDAKRTQTEKHSEFLAWFDEWLKEPDDWTPEQWDEFERDLRANRLKFRDIEI